MTETIDQASNFKEETSEQISRLESDYDKLLLENAYLTQRISQYIVVSNEILDIANSDKPQKKSLKNAYGIEFVQSFNSIKDVPLNDLKMQIPPNYFEPPVNFD